MKRLRMMLRHVTALALVGWYLAIGTFVYLAYRLYCLWGRPRDERFLRYHAIRANRRMWQELRREIDDPNEFAEFDAEMKAQFAAVFVWLALICIVGVFCIFAVLRWFGC